MEFIVVGQVPNGTRDKAYLLIDRWDDYSYKTLYILFYNDDKGKTHRIGEVKIGQFGWKKLQSRPEISSSFISLDERFFSLGQDASYYENIRNISTGFLENTLSALNDVAADNELYQRACGESVMGVSLMRSVVERTISGQYKRIIDGGARLTEYVFNYEGPDQLDTNFEPVKLSFSIDPESKPPTNIQVIIGRNGVGKSFLTNAMARALVHPDEEKKANGIFTEAHSIFDQKQLSPFANVLSVTFSAFDEFPMIQSSRNTLKGVGYTNVGLRTLKRKANAQGLVESKTVAKDTSDLTKDFIESAKLCAFGERADRWNRALKTLESDPIFEEARVADLAQYEGDKFGRSAGKLFRRLSSGHKIVLLTITKLVEKVEERTLVIMDEPEAHLHPPLLSALIRALSDLLTNRNGVAIIATHSPVVLQEVPRSCVWKMRRHGGGAVVERPESETFAESVGVLTHDVFGLEVMNSGFYKMLKESIQPEDNFESVIAKFDHKIGFEGRTLISSLLAQRDAQVRS